jgi:hypothetical protein
MIFWMPLVETEYLLEVETAINIILIIVLKFLPIHVKNENAE